MKLFQEEPRRVTTEGRIRNSTMFVDVMTAKCTSCRLTILSFCSILEFEGEDYAKKRDKQRVMKVRKRRTFCMLLLSGHCNRSQTPTLTVCALVLFSIVD